MTSLKNKIVCITGASSGIGAACAKVFAQQGAQLLLIARRKERLAELVKALQPYQVSTQLITLDIRDAQAVQNAFATLPEHWQAIDVLINNAGLAIGLDKLQEVNVADLQVVIDTNLKGLLYVTRAVLPGMLARHSGHVINISSIAGREVYGGGSVYCATKHAVDAITKALRHDVLGSGVRVSSIAPGMVKTEFSNVRFKEDQERAEAVYHNMTPLTAEDIADSVYYCASRPAHVSIADILILPTDQAAIHAVHRSAKT